MNTAEEEATRLIEALAHRVNAPTPPADLAARAARRRRPGRGAALAVVAVGVACGMFLFGPLAHREPASDAPSPVAAPASNPETPPAAAQVIVDRLQVHGRDAQPLLQDVPGAGAVVVTPRAAPASFGVVGLGFFSAAWAGEDEPSGEEDFRQVKPPDFYLHAQTSYHVRFLRAVMEPAPEGSALFETREFVIPLSDRERWGRADQSEALRGALGAQRMEALPGVVVRAGSLDEQRPQRFETALGETLVEVAFQAEPIGGGWHRVIVSAAGPTMPDGEFFSAELRIADGATVAVAAPIDDEGNTLVVGVTPLGPGPPEDFGQIFNLTTGTGITFPTRVRQVDPIYPERAREEGLTGKVIMEIVVRKDGTPDRLVVLGMPEGGEWFAGAAAEAVSQWRYSPATRNGRPIDVYLTIVVDFRLK